MFARAKKFVRNHWKKVVIGGIAIQVTGIGLRYLTKHMMTYPEIRAREMWKKVKKQQHFESMEKTCTTTYLCLLPILKETILRSLDAESLTFQLRNKTENKLEVWEKLKIIAFSRVMAAIYGSSILHVLLKIQVNIIGGYLYQESENGPNSVDTNIDGAIITSNTAIDVDLQNKYMSIADYFVNGGMKKLCQYIHERTQAVVGHLSLKQNLRISDLEQIFWAIVTSINKTSASVNEEADSSDENKNPVKFSWQYVIPEEYFCELNLPTSAHENIEAFAEPTNIHKKLLLETYDLLNSDDVWGVLKSFESHGISYFIDLTTDPFSNKPSTLEDNHTDTANETTNFADIVFPLAKIIPVMNQSVSSGVTETDPWINVLIGSENLRILGANIYESFSCDMS